jgi:hypothetical protein
MAFNEGHNWWRRRSQHGRGLLFSSPELMWEAACSYFDEADGSDYWKKLEVAFDRNSASFMSQEFVLKTPFTWEGLCLALDCSLSYFRTFKSKINKKIKEGINDDVDDNFLTVIENIDYVIKKQQIEGAMVGKFNSNIVARYLGLKDASELSTPNTEDQPNDAKEFKVTLKLD